MKKLKIKTGDTVKIIAGKDKGKTGKVEKVLLKKNKILVDGINIYKRHLKPQGQSKPGGIIDFNKPLSVANVSLICPKCGKRTRVSFLVDKNKEKHRQCKKCRQII